MNVFTADILCSAQEREFDHTSKCQEEYCSNIIIIIVLFMVKFFFPDHVIFQQFNMCFYLRIYKFIKACEL